MSTLTTETETTAAGPLMPRKVRLAVLAIVGSMVLFALYLLGLNGPAMLYDAAVAVFCL